MKNHLSDVFIKGGLRGLKKKIAITILNFEHFSDYDTRNLSEFSSLSRGLGSLGFDIQFCFLFLHFGKPIATAH